MDWGLFRSRSSNFYGLRESKEKHKYHQYFYYFAIVSNFILRFFWITGLYTFEFNDGEEDFVYKLSLWALVTLLLEAIRRTQWALIRVENEFFNNFEAYRTISLIPDLMGKVERIDPERVKKLI